MKVVRKIEKRILQKKTKQLDFVAIILALAKLRVLKFISMLQDLSWRRLSVLFIKTAQ